VRCKIIVSIAVVVVVVLGFIRSGFTLNPLICSTVFFDGKENNCDVSIVFPSDKRVGMRVVKLDRLVTIGKNYFVLYRFNVEGSKISRWGVFNLNFGNDYKIHYVNAKQFMSNDGKPVVKNETVLSPDELLQVLNSGYWNCKNCRYLQEVKVGYWSDKMSVWQVFLPNYYYMSQVEIYEK